MARHKQTTQGGRIRSADDDVLLADTDRGAADVAFTGRGDLGEADDALAGRTGRRMADARRGARAGHPGENALALAETVRTEMEREDLKTGRTSAAPAARASDAAGEEPSDPASELTDEHGVELAGEPGIELDEELAELGEDFEEDPDELEELEADPHLRRRGYDDDYEPE